MNIRFANNRKILLKEFSNIFLPLLTGLFIYLFVNKRAYISTIINIPLKINVKGLAGVFVKCWLCDMLWSYALTAALYLVLIPFRYRLILSATASFIVGVFLEGLQYFNIISGTFDVLDIIFELTAVLIAVYVIKRRKNI